MRGSKIKENIRNIWVSDPLKSIKNHYFSLRDVSESISLHFFMQNESRIVQNCESLCFFVKVELIWWKFMFFRRCSCMFDCNLHRCVDVMLIFHFSDDSWLQFQTMRRGGHHFWLSRSLLTAIWNVASRWFWFCTFQMTFDCDLQHCVEVVLIFDFSDDFSKE